MKTPIKTGSRGILSAFLFFFVCLTANSQSINKFLNFKSGESMVSLYIIGGVFAFGIIAFVVSKIVAKFSKNEDGERKSSGIYYQRRHRHRHKISKKQVS